MMLTAALAMLAAAETAPLVTVAREEPDPKAMSYAEIKAYNEKLARDDPFYIRCVKSAATGSLVKRQVSCRTNQQWNKAEERGNDEARAVVERAAGNQATHGGA